MGKTENQRSSNTSSEMDIDPRPASWNSLCPTFLDSRRIKMNLQEDSSHVIGSPPPAGPPKVLWNENFPNASSEGHEHAISALEASELSSRVQDIRIQPPQPMIICETVEDMKMNPVDMEPCSSDSLVVPTVDVANEKKRPPLSPH